MAKEFLISTTTGITVYFHLWNSVGQIWNTSGTPAFENYATANIADYDIAGTEQGTASGYYTGDMPAAAAGVYSVVAKQRVGGSPAESDPTLGGQDRLEWSGSAVVTLTSRATQTSVDTVDDFLDTEIAAIKAKTDSLTFTTANRVDSQVFGMETGTVTAAAIAADAIGSSELAATAVAEIADAVWDEATSGHIASGTFGQRLYAIRANTAQAGAATTITLDASASATDDFYNNCLIVITDGTGAGQARFITDYAGATKVATVATWATNPGADSVFVIIPFGSIPGASAPTAAEVADAVWDEARADHTTAGSFGQYVPANVTTYGGTAGTFSGGRPEVNVSHVAGTAAQAASGRFQVDVELWNGTAVPAEHTAGYPIVTIKDGTGTGELDTASGVVLAKDHTGANLATAAALDTVDNFVDTEIADIQARLPAALTAGGNMKCDVLAIDGGTAAATNAEKYFDGTGYGNVLQRTTIATLASQTSFTLTAGSADNDAYNDCVIVIEDASTAAQKAVAVVDDYTGATKTVTLRTDPAVFTMATTDVVTILACRALKPTVMNRTLDVSTGGEAGVDWANVGSPTTVVGLSGTTVKTATDVETDTADIQSRLPAALVGGRIDANVGAISADATAADNLEAAYDGTGYAHTGNTYPWTAAWDAEVQSEVQDAIEANHLDHLIAVADPGGIVANSSLWAALVSKSATPAYSSYVNTTDSLEALRDNTGTAGAGLTAVPWNAAWDAEVQSEVDDALVAQRLDELLNADSDIDGAAPPTVGSVFHELLSKTAGSFTFDQTTDSLEALRDRGDAAWTTSTLAAADVWAVATRTLTAATNITSTGAAVPITAGGLVSCDVTAISTDATAADNLEAWYDNTGYAASNSTIGTASAVTTVNGLAAGVITAAAVATGAIDADALAADAANEIADALLDRANGVETSLTPRGAFRLCVAALAGKLSGAATTTVTIRNVGDTVDRITATVDSSGNRTAVTTDAT